MAYICRGGRAAAATADGLTSFNRFNIASQPVNHRSTVDRSDQLSRCRHPFVYCACIYIYTIYICVCACICLFVCYIRDDTTTNDAYGTEYSQEAEVRLKDSVLLCMWLWNEIATATRNAMTHSNSLQLHCHLCFPRPAIKADT